MSVNEFPREARLLAPDDFVRALKTRARRGRFLWVYRNAANSVAGAARPQLGLMIGKRNAKTAVLRNAIKRRLRELFRVRQARLPSEAFVARLSMGATIKDVPVIAAEWATELERMACNYARALAQQSESTQITQPTQSAKSAEIKA